MPDLVKYRSADGASDVPVSAAAPLPVTLASGGGEAQGAGAVSATTQRVTLASDDPAVGLLTTLRDIASGEYETVAASQTDQVIGGTGAIGDYLEGLLVVPAGLSPGAVSIKDGGGSAITVFAGGATSLSNLAPIFLQLGIRSAAGAWKVTTGASISAIAIGNFT